MATKKVINIDTVFRVKKNAYNYYLTFTLTQGSSALNLTGATIQIKVADFNTPDTIKFTGNCIVTDAANGILQYLVQNGNFNIEGRFMAQLFITYPATMKYIKSDIMEVYVERGVGNV